MSKGDWRTVHFGDMVHHISERVEPDDVSVDRYVGLEHLDPESLNPHSAAKKERKKQF